MRDLLWGPAFLAIRVLPVILGMDGLVFVLLMSDLLIQPLSAAADCSPGTPRQPFHSILCFGQHPECLHFYLRSSDSELYFVLQALLDSDSAMEGPSIALAALEA